MGFWQTATLTRPFGPPSPSGRGSREAAGEGCNLESFSYGLLGTNLKVGLDKRIQIAVQHPIHITDFNFGSVILDKSIRLEHIGPDLTAPRNVELTVLNRLGFGLLLLHFDFEQPRSQNLHADVFILMLRPLVLTLDDDARGKMRDADSRIRCIDVLAPFSG